MNAEVTDDSSFWLLPGQRTPFCRVDGDLADHDAIELSIPVVQSMVDELGDGAGDPDEGSAGDGAGDPDDERA